MYQGLAAAGLQDGEAGTQDLPPVEVLGGGVGGQGHGAQGDDVRVSEEGRDSSGNTDGV